MGASPNIVTQKEYSQEEDSVSVVENTIESVAGQKFILLNASVEIVRK